MHTAIEPGMLLQVRRRPWLLRGKRPHADCCELDLEPAAGHPGAASCGAVILLAPFDRATAIAPAGGLHAVSRRAWMAALQGAILEEREPESLAAAARAKVDLLPHQLEPALAVVCRGARRLLLADAVGLGKTIEAGLVLAELRARSVLDRVLVLTPPGLCDQWCEELAGRFGMDPAIADAAWLRGLRAVLPAAVNPWSVPGIRVASLDFVKRPEVRRSIEPVWWDAVVIDEAHLAAGDSERRAAAHAFAARARFVLLLTATPHSGDPRTFQALCGIGALSRNDTVVLFRRDREQAGIARARRVHLHHVHGGAAELAVRRRLDEYIRRVWARRAEPDGRDARLAMVVLLKRSFSSMGSLRRSLATRIDRLGTASSHDAVQLPLAWEEGMDDEDAPPSAVLSAAGLEDAAEERRLLRELADAAAFAEAHDSKRRALLALLQRVREPAIVFTEYRDTLTTLQASLGADTAVLHGAMDRFERAAAIQRFSAGTARVLLATDAGGEGLNLQHRCRLVINLELPWNPMRLEQRIGRVDRIGQARTVHAINLLASGTAESGLLSRLARRIDHARRAVGAIDEVLGAGEDVLMAACLDLEGGSAAHPALTESEVPPQVVQHAELAGLARAAARRLERRRRLLRAAAARKRVASTGIAVHGSGGVLAAAVRRSRFSAVHGRTGLLAIFRVRSPAPAGLSPFEELVPVFAECPCPRVMQRREVHACASAAMATIVPRLAAVIPPRDVAAAETGRTLDRDRRLAARARCARPIQRGLFDRRAERQAEQIGREATGMSVVAAGDCTPGGDAARATPAHAPEPVLLLFVTS